MRTIFDEMASETSKNKMNPKEVLETFSKFEGDLEEIKTKMITATDTSPNNNDNSRGSYDPEVIVKVEGIVLTEKESTKVEEEKEEQKEEEEEEEEE